MLLKVQPTSLAEWTRHVAVETADFLPTGRVDARAVRCALVQGRGETDPSLVPAK